MTQTTPVMEAKRWVEKAPAGGSSSQVFELRDGRYSVVKFPENPQGIRVLVNEFICCTLAELLDLPVNRPVLVSVDGRLLSDPKAKGDCPATFTGGISCGLVRYPNAVSIGQDQLSGNVENPDELHAHNVFDVLVARGDGRQLLAYPVDSQASSKKRFAAIDYGFAFGGQPEWTLDSFRSLADPILASVNPYTQREYDHGDLLEPFIGRLRKLTQQQIDAAISTIHPPRWDASAEEIQGLPEILHRRARSLIEQFNARYIKQLEIPNE